jgi:20S proteasome alpha/beta subunit
MTLNNEMYEHLVKTSKQRAALMGFMANLIKEERDLTYSDLRKVIINFFGELIDKDLMVEDEIDLETAIIVKDALKECMAVDEAKEILGN